MSALGFCNAWVAPDIGQIELTSNTSDPVNNIVDHLLANGVVSTSIVVGSILLAADQELRVEELAVGTSPDLVDGRGVEVDEDGPGHIFAVASLGEESLERASVANVLAVGVRATVGAEAVLKEVSTATVSLTSHTSVGER